MNWRGIDSLFTQAEERATDAEAAAHDRRMARVREEAERNRPEHIIDTFVYDRGQGWRYRVECSCGWFVVRKSLEDAEDAARWHR